MQQVGKNGVCQPYGTEGQEAAVTGEKAGICGKYSILSPSCHWRQNVQVANVAP